MSLLSALSPTLLLFSPLSFPLFSSLSYSSPLSYLLLLLYILSSLIGPLVRPHGLSSLLWSQVKQLSLGDRLDLASYLLKPIQRMSKYALLLKDLLKQLSPAEEEGFNALQAANHMISFQLRHGNDLLAMDAIRLCDVSQSGNNPLDTIL